MIIAIDGYSSCGKSTFAKAIASALGYVFIDTGAMYRAVTLYALRGGLIGDQVGLVGALGGIDIEFRFDAVLGRSKVYLCGVDVDGLLRSVLVSDNVSWVSSIGAVRSKLVGMQREMGARGDVVMDGRDIGTVVFPEADLKIFMTADVDVRALRRYRELSGGGVAVSLQDVRSGIVERDRLDESRVESPLRRAVDALLLDNSLMSVDDQMRWVMDRISEVRVKKEKSI